MRVSAPVHLFRAGPGGFAGRALAPRPAGILLQLVRAVQSRAVVGNVEARADAEAVDGRAAGDELRDAVLVEPAARENPDLAQAGGVEDRAHAVCERREIAAVEPNGRDLPVRAPVRQLDDAPCGRLGVVRVDQQRDRALMRIEKVLERAALGVVRFDERMRHRSEHRNAEARVSEHRGRAGEAGQVARARGVERRLAAVRAAHAEIHQRFARRREHATRRLRRNRRLEVEQVHEPALDELRLGQRRRHAQQRLVAERRGALGNGMQIAREPQRSEPLEKRLAEEPRRAQLREILAREMQVAQIVDGLLEPGRDQEVAHRRQPAHEQLEGGRFEHPAVEVRLQHRELIQVGQQRAHALDRHRRALRARVRRGHCRSVRDRRRSHQIRSCRKRRRERRAPRFVRAGSILAALYAVVMSAMVKVGSISSRPPRWLASGCAMTPIIWTKPDSTRRAGLERSVAVPSTRARRDVAQRAGSATGRRGSTIRGSCRRSITTRGRSGSTFRCRSSASRR